MSFKSYFEGKTLTFNGQEPVIYLKPNFVAPQGYILWLSGLARKVSVVTKAEYLQQTRSILTTGHSVHLNGTTTVKNYTAELPPLEKGKYHLFAKYDFQIAEADSVLHLRVDIPNDKYLLSYMRLRLVDKAETSKRY